jgi:hypothetical protein
VVAALIRLHGGASFRCGPAFTVLANFSGASIFVAAFNRVCLLDTLNRAWFRAQFRA